MAVASNSANVSTAGSAGWLVLAGFDLPLDLVLFGGILLYREKRRQYQKKRNP